MIFDENKLIIHRVEIRPDDVIEIAYSQPRFVFDWGAKVELWTFMKDKVPTVEISALEDCIDDLITRIELAARGEE